HAAELSFPTAIENHPVDMATTRVGLPTIRPRSRELHVTRRTHWIIRVWNRLDRRFANRVTNDCRRDAFASHIRKFLIHELRRKGTAFADKAGVEPFLGDPFKLPKEVELGFFPRVTPLRVKQSLGDVKEQC